MPDSASVQTATSATAAAETSPPSPSPTTTRAAPEVPLLVVVGAAFDPLAVLEGVDPAETADEDDDEEEEEEGVFAAWHDEVTFEGDS